jgi:hypothetical protein
MDDDKYYYCSCSGQQMDGGKSKFEIQVEGHEIERAGVGRIQDTIQKRNAKWHVTGKRVYTLAHSSMLADEKKGGQLDWENEITRNGK